MSFPGRLGDPSLPIGASEAFAGSSDASRSRSSTEGFQILDWHPAYQSCQRYFLDVAQHDAATQAVAAFMNIQLPSQWSISPVMTASGNSAPPAPESSAFRNPFTANPPGQSPGLARRRSNPLAWASLIPYIRRMVVTGFDKEPILHGFFGDDWRRGVGPIHEVERRNYLFTTKSVGWAKAKHQYDMSPHETVPFMKPLEGVTHAELEAAEKNWGQWLAMQDWMIGPQAPDSMNFSSSQQASS